MPSSATSAQRAKTASRQPTITGQDSVAVTAATWPRDHHNRIFSPCTATPSLFLYAQANVIRCLHHDTLAIERKFEKHKGDVLVLSADNVSESGAGRMVTSYDDKERVIVWDLLTGDEVAEFSAYENILVASWMRDGSVAYGNFPPGVMQILAEIFHR